VAEVRSFGSCLSRFVINEAFGRDLYLNGPPAEMCSFVDERSLDDRRSVASRPDFRARGFRVPDDFDTLIWPTNDHLNWPT
jgi:hypothetical protein